MGKFRVIAIDCRGHGRSDKPHDPAAYGLEMAADIVRLLDARGIGRAHIVGYSMGAEIALKVATQYPDRVLSLVLGGSGWTSKDDYDASYKPMADSLEKSGSFGDLLRVTTPADLPPPTEAEIASFDKLLEGNDIVALAAVARAMADIVDISSQQLSDLHVPVLGIAGEHDPERCNLEKMGGVVRNFTMRVLPGSDHMSAPADPQFKIVIREFLSSQL